MQSKEELDCDQQLSEYHGVRDTLRLTTEDGRWNGTAESLVDTRKHAGEWRGVVTSQGPQDTTNCEESANNANHD